MCQGFIADISRWLIFNYLLSITILYGKETGLERLNTLPQIT